MNRLFYFTFLVLISLTSVLHAQDDGESKKKKKFKVKKNIKVANKMLEKGNIYAASDLYEEILEYKPEHVNVAHSLAESYFVARDYESAEKWYGKVVEIAPDEYPQDRYYQALMMKYNGKYTEAKPMFVDFDKTYKGDNYREMTKWAEIEAEGCDLALRMLNNPVAVEVNHLDKEVNSSYSDISPMLWDDTTLLYASLPSDTVIVVDEDNEQQDRFVKFYQATTQGTSYKRGGPFTKFNIPGKHIANGSYSPDKKEFFFTRCDEANKEGNILCFIYMSTLENGQWSEPVALDAVNAPNATNTHPVLANYSKGEILYFTSDREGGKGGKDIWYSTRNSRDGSFRSARNLGRKINTDRDEATPFYDATNEVLYFSSNGHAGIGGYDVFKSKGERNKWESKPTNVGYPLNSSTDDMYYRLKDDAGKTGFIVSNRPGVISIRSKTCCDDIFEFKFLKIINVAVEGYVFDESDTTNTPIDGARVALSLKGYKGLDSDILVKDDTTANGEMYFFDLNVDEDYKVTGSVNGYLTNSADFTTKGIVESDTLRVDLYLKRLELDKAYRLKNVYYDFDKWFLREASKLTLDTVYNIMMENPTIIVEIGSHTDIRGSDAYNANLSQKRAESCVEYLIGRGIPQNRLQAKGYGETQNLEDCSKYEECPDDNEKDCPCHQLNRRTEFKIIGELDAELEYEDPRYEEVKDDSNKGKKK